MRTLKLRAFDDDKKEMIYNFKKSNYQLLWDEDNKEFFCGGLQTNGDWNQPTLMQFTGLLDKNGKEIYEGDILQHPDSDYPFKVIFKKGAFRIQSLEPSLLKNDTTASISHVEFSEVIGNIHEAN